MQKKRGEKKKSAQGDGGLFVQAEGNKSGKFPSRDALRGKKIIIKKKARQNQPCFVCPMGRSEFDAEGALLNFLITV